MNKQQHLTVTELRTSDVNKMLPQHVMEGDFSTLMQFLNLIAHVLEQQSVPLQVHFQPTTQQS